MPKPSLSTEEQIMRSITKYGGQPQDFASIHAWFDEPSSWIDNYAFHAVRHHAQGIFVLEKKLGPILTLSNQRQIPVRVVAEQHLLNDFGFIPSAKDWSDLLQPATWMGRSNPDFIRFLKEKDAM